MNNYKSAYKNLIWVILILAVVLVFIFTQNDIDDLFAVLRQTLLLELFFGVMMIALYWFLWAMSLHFIVKSQKLAIDPCDSYCIASSDLFFNGITPFSTGGQPFQVYAYMKAGVKASDATGILMMNFIIYQIAINGISTVALVFYYPKLAQAINSFPVLVFIGYFINMFILILLFLASLSSKFSRLTDGVLMLLSRIKPLNKFMLRFRTRTFDFVCDFQKGFKVLLNNKGLLIKVFLTKVGALLAFYSVPYFILRALGIDLGVESLLYILAMSSFAMTFMVWIPTPGAAGAAEFAFTVLFVLISGVTLPITVAGALLWRGLTYYLTMLYGLITTIVFERRRKSL